MYNIYAVVIFVLRPSGVCSVLGGDVWHGTGQYHSGRDGYCGSEVVWLIVWTVLTGTRNKITEFTMRCSLILDDMLVSVVNFPVLRIALYSRTLNCDSDIMC